MKRKMSWRNLKFVPIGGDESQAVTRKHKAFMHLCELLRDHPGRFDGYSLNDTRGMFDRYGPNNVTVSWSDFRVALAQHKMKAPPGKPTVFCGEYFPPDHTIRMRKRLLASVLREYIFPESLAEDLLEWLARGREDDVRKFMVTLLHGVGWLDQVPKTAEEAMAKPIEQLKGQVLLT